MTVSGEVVEKGRVAAVGESHLWIETVRQSTCQSCSAQKACGHGILNSIDKGRRHQIKVLIEASSNTDYRIDDEVEISIPDHLLVKGALIVYLLPLFAMLSGAFLMSCLWVGDVPAVIGAAFGFFTGILLVKYHANKLNNELEFNPLVKRSGSNRRNIISQA